MMLGELQGVHGFALEVQGLNHFENWYTNQTMQSLSLVPFFVWSPINVRT